MDMFLVKVKDKELYYGGYMLFYESKERGAKYNLEKAQHIADLFDNGKGEIEVVPC